MIWLSIGLVITSLLLGLIPMQMTRNFRAKLRKRSVPDQSYTPKTSLILPCKGLDPGFRDNMQAFFNQDYPNLELLFVVADSQDPAYDEISRLIAEKKQDFPDRYCQLFVAGTANCRTQKLTNQLCALEQVAADSQVVCFVDSDIRPRPDFLRNLIAPLQDTTVGCATGFRWYQPPQPTAGSMMRSIWNAAALPFLVDPKRNFAWGGAMAIKKDIFDKAEIAQAFDGAASDDFPVTHGVKKLGLQVKFVPECIAITYESSTALETLEFTNRQSIFSRIYHPPLWWGAAIAHSLSNFLILYGLFCLAMLFKNPDNGWLIGVGCLAIIPLQMANVTHLINSLIRYLPNFSANLEKLKWYYALYAPPTSWMSLINTLYSMSTRKITWRGIRYELVSTTETKVLSSKDQD